MKNGCIMVHVAFNPDLIRLNNIIYQQGSGYYTGYPRQRGAGVGDFFRILWRFMTPVLKNVGKEGLKSGINLLDDVNTGENFKKSLKKHSKLATANVLNNISTKLRSQNGGGKRKKIINDKKFPVGRSVFKKPIKKDIFNGL